MNAMAAQASSIEPAGALDVTDASSSQSSIPALADSEQLAALRSRVATLEAQLAAKRAAAVAMSLPAPLRTHDLPAPAAHLSGGRPRPEVSPEIFDVLRDGDLLPRAVPLHIVCVASTAERKRIGALARKANELASSVIRAVLHESADAEQAVGLLRAGVLCDLVLLCADSDADLVRLAVSAVRKEVRDTVPIVVAMEEVDLKVINIAIRCGADALVLRPFGADFVYNAWQHCLRREPLFFERKLGSPASSSASHHPSPMQPTQTTGDQQAAATAAAAAAAAAGVTGTDWQEELMSARNAAALRLRGPAPENGGNRAGGSQGGGGGAHSTSPLSGVTRLTGDGDDESDEVCKQQ